MKKMICLCMLGSWVLLSSGMGIAGDYLIVPVQGQQITSWDKKISGASRFQLVLDDAAVLDRETGLVWEKRPCRMSLNPDFCKAFWQTALDYCYEKNVGGRKGWRLPTIEELASLIDMAGGGHKLPDGHPFIGVYASAYWSVTSRTGHEFARIVRFDTGSVINYDKESKQYWWCVRGGYGHDQ
jgi:hypothetical protein